MEAGLDAPLYSCTPAGSGGANCGREVHVIANYDCGPSSVVSVSVTMDSTRHSSNNSKPLVFILMNSRPIHWLLEIPDNVTVQRVILTGQNPRGSNVSYTRSKVETVSTPNTSLLFGYGPDSGTPQALNYIQKCFGPIASFSGVFSSKGWSLNISRSQSSEAGCEFPSGTQNQPSDVQCATEIAPPNSLTPSTPPAIPIGTLRLSGGDVCSGQLQLFTSCAKYLQWLHLASASFGVEEGRVACRQLGCPSVGVAITSNVTRTYSKYIETSFKCQGSEDHLFSCASSSNETCHTQDDSTVEVVMVSCTTNLMGGDDGQKNATSGVQEPLPTSPLGKDADIGQASGSSSGSNSDIHATQTVTGTSLAFISSTSSTYRASTRHVHSGAGSASEATAVSPTRVPALHASSTATKKPGVTKIPTTEPPVYVSSNRQTTPSPMQPTKLLDNFSSKKGQPTTASEDISPTSKYVAGCVMALILAAMIFIAMGLSIYYHLKRRRENQERSATGPNDTGETETALSRSESVHTNSRLFIVDQRCAEESERSFGCSEPPPSYLSVAEPPPPAYETLVQLRPAIVLSESVQTVV